MSKVTMFRFRTLMTLAIVSVLGGCGGSGLPKVTLPLSTSEASAQAYQVAPGEIGKLAQTHRGLWLPRASYLRAAGVTSCIYLADNLSSNLYVYNAGNLAQIGILTSPKGYGWGVAATSNTVYAGTYYDTIDEYTPCNGTRPTKTLTGGGNGYPFGITIAPGGTIYADEWPTNRIDYWSNGKRHSGSDPKEGSTYFLAVDKAGDVFTAGYGKGSKYGVVDRCTSALRQCSTVVGNIGFPSGIAFDNNNNLYVSDGQGSVSEYSGCTASSPKCTLVDSISLTFGFEGIALPTKDAYLWGAAYFPNSSCSGGSFTCGNAIALFLPFRSGPPARSTTLLENALPIGIAFWPPTAL